jgi:hypothetical protein
VARQLWIIQFMYTPPTDGTFPWGRPGSPSGVWPWPGPDATCSRMTVLINHKAAGQLPACSSPKTYSRADGDGVQYS